MANHKKPVTLSKPTFGKLPAAQMKGAPKVAVGEPHPPTAPKTPANPFPPPTAPANVKLAEAPAPKPIVEAKPAIAPEPDGPMSLADVNAILADDYPGFEPTNVRGESAGLKFALPGGGSITVERARIKKCANMEELRAYIDSVK